MCRESSPLLFTGLNIWMSRARAHDTRTDETAPRRTTLARTLPVAAPHRIVVKSQMALSLTVCVSFRLYLTSHYLTCPAGREVRRDRHETLFSIVSRPRITQVASHSLGLALAS